MKRFFSRKKLIKDEFKEYNFWLQGNFKSFVLLGNIEKKPTVTTLRPNTSLRQPLASAVDWKGTYEVILLWLAPTYQRLAFRKWVMNVLAKRYITQLKFMSRLLRFRMSPLTFQILPTVLNSITFTNDCFRNKTTFAHDHSILLF